MGVTYSSSKYIQLIIGGGYSEWFLHKCLTFLSKTRLLSGWWEVGVDLNKEILKPIVTVALVICIGGLILGTTRL
jgi:hypothetical protein